MDECPYTRPSCTIRVGDPRRPRGRRRGVPSRRTGPDDGHGDRGVEAHPRPAVRRHRVGTRQQPLGPDQGCEGRVWSWGSNEQGGLGHGTHADVAEPGQPTPAVSTTISDAVEVKAGTFGRQFIVRRRNGTLIGWGNSDWGQLLAGWELQLRAHQGRQPVVLGRAVGGAWPARCARQPAHPRQSASDEVRPVKKASPIIPAARVRARRLAGQPVHEQGGGVRPQGATLTLVWKVSIPSTSESATRYTMASPEFRPYFVPRPTSASEVTVTPFG